MGSLWDVERERETWQGSYRSALTAADHLIHFPLEDRLETAGHSVLIHMRKRVMLDYGDHC